MFTIEQIQAAHAKVTSGADFPAYVKDLIELGVKKYDTYVLDGHAQYYGADSYTISSEAKYPALDVTDVSDNDYFIERLRLHQQGGTDYMTFCSDAAQSGVEKWTVDTDDMTCTYYDKPGNSMLVENIPS
jgi:uncharacterized protein YbcV (DUF1398 family)